MGNACQCCISPHSDVSSSHGGTPPPLTSGLPPSIDSLKLLIQQVNPTDQIDPLINLIEVQLERIKASSEKASTSSSLLTSAVSNTSLAAKCVDTISTEADKLFNSDIAKEMGSLAKDILNMVGEAHWMFLGLSVAAYALERCVTATSNVAECRELLQRIAFLAKDLKRFKEVMPEQSERLCQGVQIVVEGAIICCDYISKGKRSRYWSATTTMDQLEKTNRSIDDIQGSLDLAVGVEGYENTKKLLQSSTMRLEESPLNLLDFEPVGIEKEVEEVKALLDMEGTEPALAVVLCGFGGMGKSTLAASVIQKIWTQHRISANFKFCRVIINDKSADETSHITKLQQDIIYDFGGGKQGLRNPEEGRLRLQKAMENKSCLLFIDNAVDKKYIKQLLPKNLPGDGKNKSIISTENLEKGKTKLRILVTSRENLRPEFSITYKEYEVGAFSKKAARCLLSQTILQSDGQFSGDFAENGLMNAVADACRGVPILLSVFGKHLRYNREPESYKEALGALRQGNLDSFADEDLSKQLFFVYNKLRNNDDKEAFLDICKYFYGWQWNLVCKILDEARLKALQRKMLINKSDSGVVIVHDILRLMGEKEAKQTRVSNYSELSQVLKDDANLKNIKGISLVENESLITLECSHLNATCQSLRVLIIGDWVEFHGPLCDGDFQNLRYLSVGDAIGFPFEDPCKLHKVTAFFNRSKHGMNLHRLPRSLKVISQQVADPDCHSFETLPLQNLPSLQSFIVETRKSVKFPEEFQLPASLVDLQLNSCRQLPKDFNNLAALERLVLDKCDLEILPQGIGELNKLKHLSMEHCTKLTSLPEELGLLSSMICLRLSGCTLLQKLPDDLGKLSALEELSIAECENLSELPQGFGGLYSLQKFDSTGCIRLQRLPESFAKLRIETLTLQSLPSLDELPESIGNMPFLTHLKLISCDSLKTLPNSFVLLKCLETLEIKHCNKLVALPRDFGQLSSLKEMIVRRCTKLKELPHGFQALPALEAFTLIACSSLVNLPSEFGELICLEFLRLEGLLFSSLPDGFGKLKRLDALIIKYCFKLETLPDDFEMLASLTWVELQMCPNLCGGEMVRILKLQQCYYIDIERSAKLIERWEEMRDKEEYPMLVCTGTDVNVLDKDDDIEEWKRAAGAGLLGANCKELNSTKQNLMERSISRWLEVGTTVAVIALPVRVEVHHYPLIKRFVELAVEKVNTSGRLQIVYVRRVKWEGERRKEEEEEKEEEEKEEEECFRQILMSNLSPDLSCAIPSTDMRRHRLITWIFFECMDHTADKLACCMVNVGVDDKDHKFVQYRDDFGEDDMSGEALQSSENADEANSIGNFLESIYSGKLSGTAGQSQYPPKESRFTDFLQILKENKKDHLIDSKLELVQLDQLKGNVVGIFICDLNTQEYIKLQQINKELKCYNFEVIWIPSFKNEFYGYGTYRRVIQGMTWKALPNPNIVKVANKNPHCIIFDQEGRIANRDALSSMMSWGAEAFPFTQSKINEIVSTISTESILKSLFNKIKLVNDETTQNKLTFLYAEPPSSKLKMKFNLEQLVQLHSNVQIIYVGYFFVEDCDMRAFKEVYEDVIQKMHWPKLSFEDMVTFWYRCKYLSQEMEDDLMIELKKIAKLLYIEKRWLVVLDIDGVVTGSGYEMVKMMCKTNDEKRDEVDVMMKNELLESLKSEKCNQNVKTFFKDIIINHPKHLQHHLVIRKQQREEIHVYYCDSCYSSKLVTWEQQRVYSCACDKCDWDLCIKCWELFVKGQYKAITKAKGT